MGLLIILLLVTLVFVVATLKIEYRTENKSTEIVIQWGLYRLLSESTKKVGE